VPLSEAVAEGRAVWPGTEAVRDPVMGLEPEPEVPAAVGVNWMAAMQVAPPARLVVQVVLGARVKLVVRVRRRLEMGD
jgi:hypothetical protein